MRPWPRPMRRPREQDLCRHPSRIHRARSHQGVYPRHAGPAIADGLRDGGARDDDEGDRPDHAGRGDRRDERWHRRGHRGGAPEADLQGRHQAQVCHRARAARRGCHARARFAVAAHVARGRGAARWRADPPGEHARRRPGRLLRHQRLLVRDDGRVAARRLVGRGRHAPRARRRGRRCGRGRHAPRRHEHHQGVRREAHRRER